MDEDDRQVLLAAAILLAPSIERMSEADLQGRIKTAVTTARNLHAEVKRQHEEASAAMPTDGVQKAYEQEAKRTGRR
jgi:hypothetical protein